MSEKTGLPEQKPNPTLTAAGAEIETVLKKYDLPGFAVMFYDMQIQTVVRLNGGDSVVSLNEGRALRIHPPMIDPQNQGEAKRKVAYTINMLFNLRTRCFQFLQLIGQAEQEVRARFGMAQTAKPGNGQVKKLN